VEFLVKIAILGLFVWAAWAVGQPRCLFVVRIIGAQPQVAKGVVTPAFVEHLRNLCQEHGIERGSVRGLVRKQRISLAFSRNIPPEAQQALRNWWAISGWSAAPRRR